MSQDTVYMNVSADSTSVIIVGLDKSLRYNVQVSAGTKAGQGVQSAAVVAAGMQLASWLATIIIITHKMLLVAVF